MQILEKATFCGLAGAAMLGPFVPVVPDKVSPWLGAAVGGLTALACLCAKWDRVGAPAAVAELAEPAAAAPAPDPAHVPTEAEAAAIAAVKQRTADNPPPPRSVEPAGAAA